MPRNELLPRNEEALAQARLVSGSLLAGNSRGEYASSAAFANFREIRMGEIAPRRLYRSSHPARYGTPRFAFAQQLAENARVRAVLNLADTEEQISAHGAGSPWYQNFINRKTIIALSMGTDYTDSDFEAKLYRAMRFIIANEGPYLLHGGEGIERTGFAAALLEALMGAGPEEIIEDFMKSYENYYRLDPGSGEYRAISAIPEDMLRVITQGRAHVNLSEAAERYFLDRGLGAEEIAALRARLAD